MNIPFDTIITILVIGSFAVSILSSLSRASSAAQKRAQEQSELERQNAERERKRREADPNTQSMQSYLERTRQGQLEAGAPDDFKQPARPDSFAADFQQSTQLSEQERLRREMGRKMGRAPSGAQESNRAPSGAQGSKRGPSGTTASTAPSRGQPQSLEDLLREFTQAVDGRQTQPAPPTRSAPKSSRPTSATPRPAPRPDSQPIESSIRPSMLTASGSIENQGTVVNVSAAAAERAISAERESQGASVISKGSQTRSWESATTGDIVRAIIWTEILNPPKSRRKHH